MASCICRYLRFGNLRHVVHTPRTTSRNRSSNLRKSSEIMVRRKSHTLEDNRYMADTWLVRNPPMNLIDIQSISLKEILSTSTAHWVMPVIENGPFS